AHYQRGVDPSGQLSAEQLRAADKLTFSADAAVLNRAEVIIVAVPTPVDVAHQPDFGPLLEASRIVGERLRPGAIIIYESTVYPGATEEICIPALEQASGLKWRQDFHVGYSPERINPGDGVHTLTNIVKVVAADDELTLKKITALYESIVKAGVHPVSSIKVAEAAKVIENTQRDLNIALMNELAIIFNRIGVDTLEVLQAAETKWNFLSFRPGLVGGHCIGVDPYYLTHKAEMVGYHPQVILAGRRINDGMGKFIAEHTIKCMARQGDPVKGAKVNVLGLSFKEDCPDVRNSRVFAVIRELQSYGTDVYVHDPVVSAAEARNEYGIQLIDWDALPIADALIVAVAHRKFIETALSAYLEKLAPNGCFVDVKSRFDAKTLQAAGVAVWRL
ncbi:MAG: nucleotide sugar dehydrogenase, partial [Acidiferrobacterales bacterium]